MRERQMTTLTNALNDSRLSDTEKNKLIEEFKQEENNYLRSSRKRQSQGNYDFISLIGKGGFADVWLVVNKSTSDINVLKIIRKKDVILSDQIENVKNERNVLSLVSNPWIVKLYSSFQDSEHLYLVLDFVQGGDLLNALNKFKTFPPSVCRFFAAEIAIALNSVHELGFIHGDVKPDNILIDKTGHIKLTDFGIASQYGKNDKCYDDLLASAQDLMLKSKNGTYIISTAGQRKAHKRSSTIIGSIDYIAPEILKGEKPTTKSDFWALGIVLYEMFFGFTPFSGNSKKETALRIINWKKALRIPASHNLPQSALILLKQLLCDKENRIGYEEIVRHPFFAGFDFVNPFGMTTPIKPQVTDPLDTSHFESFADVKKEELRASSVLNNLASFVFKGYTFKAKPPTNALARLGIYN
jgi:serine/threonine protein kinase